MNMQPERQQNFRKNENLESLLKELNDLLGRAEASTVKQFVRPRHPVIIVVGAPRSGTTMTMQWLAYSGEVAYPSNFLSRFYAAPYIGAKIQELMANPKYDYGNELYDPSWQQNQYKSNVGKTKGMLEPSEFWYFWRRFIPNIDPEYLNDDALKKIDGQGLLAGLASIQAVFEKPFAMKGIILQYNLSYLANLLDNVLFIYTKRRPFYNIQSLMEARVKFYGSRDTWFSVKPKEYDVLKDKDPYIQVAGQIHYTNTSIEEEIRTFNESNVLVVNHEEFCRNPAKYYEVLCQKLKAQDFELNTDYKGPVTFHLNNSVRVSREEEEKIVAAYKKVSGIEIDPRS